MKEEIKNEKKDENNKKKILINIIYVLSIIALIIYIAEHSLNKIISYNDETTIFREVLQMAKGYKIYKDINVLVTPLYFYFGKVFLKVFGQTLLSYRILEICIVVFYMFSVLYVLKALKIKKNARIFFMINILVIQSEIIGENANYNVLAISLSLISIGMMIKHFNQTDNEENQHEQKIRNPKYYIIQGIMLFLIYMSKQNIAAYHFIGFVVIEFAFNKESAKEKTKNIITYILSALVLVILYGLILLAMGSLNSFIDYTILGMLDFKENYSFESPLILLVIINIIPVLIGWYKKKIDINQKSIFIFSVLMLLIDYPITCIQHTLFAFSFTLISFSYYIYKLVESYDGEKFKEILSEIILAIVTCMSVYIVAISIPRIKDWKQNMIQDRESPYYGAKYDNVAYEAIRTIDSYILSQNKNIVIVSPKASFYNLPLGKYNGILDLPLKGNVGYKGDQKIMEALEKLDDDTLIMTTVGKYDQEYDNVKRYFIQNYAIVDEKEGVEKYIILERR